MPKFLEKWTKKLTDEAVQEKIPTAIDLLIAGIGVVIFFFGGGRGRTDNQPYSSVTNNYYYYDSKGVRK